MKKVFIYPSGFIGNEYINIQEKAIREAGLDVTYSLSDFFSADYFLLNWFETLGKNERLDYVKKRIKLTLLSLFRKKILFVIHNRRTHTRYEDNAVLELSIDLMKRLLRLSTKIIILCEETRNVIDSLCKGNEDYSEKIYKIPHPNYIGSYPSCNDESKKPTNRLSFLYFGQIDRYKNIELLIEAFNGLAETPNVSLTIAGNCKDKEYAERLRSSIKNVNVTCDFRYIPDEEIVSYIGRHCALVIPYSLESSLNSGTIFLAFSCKRTVISPLIGTLKEFEDRDFYYSYSYNNQQEHKDKLQATIHKAVEDWQSNPNILYEKGIEAYETVKENNSFSKIVALYKRLFQEI